MLLVIDVGNTNIVFGGFEGEKLVYDWRISSDKEKTSDEYGLLFDQIFQAVRQSPIKSGFFVPAFFKCIFLVKPKKCKSKQSISGGVSSKGYTDINHVGLLRFLEVVDQVRP